MGAMYPTSIEVSNRSRCHAARTPMSASASSTYQASCSGMYSSSDVPTVRHGSGAAASMKADRAMNRAASPRVMGFAMIDKPKLG